MADEVNAPEIRRFEWKRNERETGDQASTVHLSGMVHKNTFSVIMTDHQSLPKQLEESIYRSLKSLVLKFGEESNLLSACPLSSDVLLYVALG